MATQHEIARRLFPLITDATRRDDPLTYKDAAIALGFETGYSRAIAQVCDLLDAAAAWMGVPLLALWCVRSSDGSYNSKAFGQQGQVAYRDAIFQRSISHHFTEQDFDAIYGALEGEFANDSNVSSWRKIYAKFGGRDEVWARLASTGLLEADALNDLGSDLPDLRLTYIQTFVRNEKVRQAVLRRAKGKCEYCGIKGFKHFSGGIYLECHHIVPLAHDGEDRLTNVIALCPNDHREAHFGANRVTLEEEMIAIVMAKATLRKRL